MIKCKIKKDCANCTKNCLIANDYPCKMHKICVNGNYAMFTPLTKLVGEQRLRNIYIFNDKATISVNEYAIPRFEVIKAKNLEYYFVLKTSPNTLIAHSETYKKLASCLKGINSVLVNVKRTNGIELFVDKQGKQRFRLRANNNKILMTSSNTFEGKLIDEIKNLVSDVALKAQIVLPYEED